MLETTHKHQKVTQIKPWNNWKKEKETGQINSIKILNSIPSENTCTKYFISLRSWYNYIDHK